MKLLTHHWLFETVLCDAIHVCDVQAFVTKPEGQDIRKATRGLFIIVSFVQHLPGKATGTGLWEPLDGHFVQECTAQRCLASGQADAVQ